MGVEKYACECVMAIISKYGYGYGFFCRRATFPALCLSSNGKMEPAGSKNRDIYLYICIYSVLLLTLIYTVYAMNKDILTS